MDNEWAPCVLWPDDNYRRIPDRVGTAKPGYLFPWERDQISTYYNILRCLVFSKIWYMQRNRWEDESGHYKSPVGDRILYLVNQRLQVLSNNYKHEQRKIWQCRLIEEDIGNEIVIIKVWIWKNTIIEMKNSLQRFK